MGEARGQPRRRFIRAALRWGLALACVAFIVVTLARNGDALRSMADLNPWSLALLAGLYLFHFTVYSFRFQTILLKCSGRPVPFLRTLSLVVNGMLINSLFPQAGNVYRSVRMKREHGVSYTSYVTTYLSFMWMDMCLNLTLALVVLAVTQSTVRICNLPGIAIIACLLVPTVLTPPLLVLVFRGRAPKWRPLARVWEKASTVLNVTVGALRDPVYLLKVGLAGLVLFANMVTIFYVAFLGLRNIPLDAGTLALFYVLYKLSMYIMLTPANLGLREVAYGFLGEQVGIGLAEGLLVCTALRLMNYIVVGGMALGLSRTAPADNQPPVEPDEDAPR